MCHAEDRVMAMSGYSDKCIMSAVTCTGTGRPTRASRPCTTATGDAFHQEHRPLPHG